MKKTLTLIAFAGMFAFTACGPSQADLDKAKKMHDDSVRMADSTAAAAAKMQATQDSIANAQKEADAKMKMQADSTRMADSLAALKKGPKKPSTPVVPKVKAGQGKG
jgi:hypothetical protein